MLAIKNNIMAQNAARHLGKAYDGLAKSVERLSSGLRINSAKDDAAGLAVRELIRADIAVQQQGARNAQDGISMLQTMEGAMAAMDENLIRMQELAEQAATGSYSGDQRQIMNAEFVEMANEIERIANAASFNEITMLDDPTEATVSIHVGTDETIDIKKVDMTQKGLGIETGTGGTTVLSETANGVSNVTNTWVTATDTTGGKDVTLTITFDDGGVAEDPVAITLTAGIGGTEYSLQDIIDKINMVSQNLGNDENGESKNYKMAEAYLDSSKGKYVLKLSSRLSGADGVSIDLVKGDADSVSGGLDSTGVDQTDGGAGDSFDAADTAAAGLNILTTAAAQDALDTVVAAIGAKDSARASFGYKMNRLESTIAILDIQAENLGTAESRISDVDVATEMAILTRTQVLSQAGVSMLAQANAMPQMALTLLR